MPALPRSKRLLALGITALHLATAHAQEQPATGADNFADAVPILTGSALSHPTNLNTKTQEPGEPFHAPTGSSAGKSAWWKWTAPQTGWCTVDTLTDHSGFRIKDSVLAVYTGSSVGSLIAIAKNDDAFLPGASTPYSRVTFRALQGVTYHIAVDTKSLADISPPDQIYTQLQLALMPDNTAFQAVGFFYDPLDPIQHALLTVSKTGSNSYSGKLNYRGKTYPLRGQIQPNGRSIAIINIKNDPVPIVLHLNFAGLPADIHLEKGADIINGQLAQTAPSNTLDPALLGRHTLIMADDMGLRGFGSGSYVVKKTGACTGAFILPDGTAFSASGKALDFGVAGTTAFYAYKPLHKKQGSVLQACLIDPSAPYGNVGVIYHRPASSGSFYPAGFAATFAGATRAYSKPQAGRFADALNASGGDGFLTLSPNLFPADPFAGVATPVNLSDKNKFTFSDPSQKPKLTFNLNTGMITGQIRPDPALPAFKIRAVAFDYAIDPGTYFYGHYQTPLSTGRLTVTPP